MKRFIEGFLAICVLAACASLYAQTAPARRTPPPPAREAPAAKEPVKTTARSIDGFSKTKWGDSLNSVKNNVLGKITYTDEKKIITSRDGDIEYLYGFFVREAAPAADTGDTAAAATEPRLYYVAVRFPYLAMDEVKPAHPEISTGRLRARLLKTTRGPDLGLGKNAIVIGWTCTKRNQQSKDHLLGKELAKGSQQVPEEVFKPAVRSKY